MLDSPKECYFAAAQIFIKMQRTLTLVLFALATTATYAEETVPGHVLQPGEVAADFQADHTVADQDGGK